jgi:MoxR-like ATPase
MTQRETAAPETVGAVARAVANIKDNIEKVLVGKGGVIELTLAAVLSGGHILIEDVPGIGKTTLARTLASSLDCTFQDRKSVV